MAQNSNQPSHPPWKGVVDIKENKEVRLYDRSGTCIATLHGPRAETNALLIVSLITPHKPYRREWTDIFGGKHSW